MSARRSIVVIACLSIGLGGCGHPARQSVIMTSAPSEYPGVLHDPRTLLQDFMVRQSLTIRTQREGKPVEFELEAVLQKQGDTLLIVGLGPMDAKAFTLTQRSDRIEFVQFMGPELPFSPRNIVVDVHRVYFKRLPAPPPVPAPPGDPAGSDAGYSGVLRGELDGEIVEETWRDGQLRSSTFTRPGSTRRGAVRVDRGPGCDRSRCEPESATLRNEWFGYTLTIASDGYERL